MEKRNVCKWTNIKLVLNGDTNCTELPISEFVYHSQIQYAPCIRGAHCIRFHNKSAVEKVLIG